MSTLNSGSQPRTSASDDKYRTFLRDKPNNQRAHRNDLRQKGLYNDANANSENGWRSRSQNKDFDRQHSQGKYFENENTHRSRDFTSDHKDRRGHAPIVHDPKLFRVFFRSPDKIRSLEDAQVFISHIKCNYGPLTQYQFSRCPETKRYFGYGFFTFKHEESLKKALADGYIRVGMKDFELLRTGHVQNPRTILHRNTGFYGFYDIEKLRANRAQELQRLQASDQGTVGESAQGGSQTDIPSTVDAKPFSSESFVSVLPTPSLEPSSEILASTPEPPRAPQPSEAPAATLRGNEESSAQTSGHDATSKPYYIRLRNKGHMAQLWKTIPDEIERTERKQVAQSELTTEAKDPLSDIVKRPLVTDEAHNLSSKP
ncbi:hypothetical protein EDD11_008947 [Mortierella claussenii]|nr:hypothetical protein EDD11_008947 [Mortierella claussenii]